MLDHEAMAQDMLFQQPATVVEEVPFIAAGYLLVSHL
jgi:hypothetical protein